MQIEYKVQDLRVLLPLEPASTVMDTDFALAMLRTSENKQRYRIAHQVRKRVQAQNYHEHILNQGLIDRPHLLIEVLDCDFCSSWFFHYECR
ncbi:hypothetical protein C8R48DRAFT_729659 [Suillus tomentosus]|nr:hypothetical protein C8R48DRAFT_729659 [Suillus tomentosus]